MGKFTYMKFQSDGKDLDASLSAPIPFLLAFAHLLG